MKIWRNFIHPVTSFFRRRRAKALLGLYPGIVGASVCDYGGSRHFWEKLGSILCPRQVAILNVKDDHQSEAMSGGNMEILIFDGFSAPFEDARFDLVMCNSVIEHIPTEHRQRAMNEVRRLGRGYFVQTPAFAFPIEPHFVMPFMHWLPRWLGRHIAHLSVYRLLTRSDSNHIDAYFDEINLLRKCELLSYFPDRHGVIVERVFGIPKSYTVYRIPQ